MCICTSQNFVFSQLILYFQAMGACLSDPEQEDFGPDKKNADYDSDEPETCSEDSFESVEKHAFLSHSRGSNADDGSDIHAMISKINSYLNSRGIKTLFEEDKMNIEAIDHAKYIVIFATMMYFDPANYNLDKELVRRYIKRKGLDRVVVVVMEKALVDMKSWEGPIGAILRDQPYIDLSESKVFRRQVCTELIEKLSVVVDGFTQKEQLAASLKRAAPITSSELNLESF
jgi:hypothetical protein